MTKAELMENLNRKNDSDEIMVQVSWRDLHLKPIRLVDGCMVDENNMISVDDEANLRLVFVIELEE